jgi:glycosyltransferase involved in cell wall biosynthesis
MNKKSILVIADFPNWAYYEIQQFIRKNLSDDFDIYCDFLIFNSIKKSKNPIKRIKLLVDGIKYRHIKKDNTYDIVVYLAFYFPNYMKINWKSKKIIKGIYTDGFPPSNSEFKGGMTEFVNMFLNDADAIVCGSEQIKNRYKKLVNNVFCANANNNKLLFTRKSRKKINNSDIFLVGWTGNPNREFKGFYSHIIPAVKLAQKKYPNIQLATRFSGPMKTLPGFYENIDVVLIASTADAGPSLFMDACIMGIPAISTNIGKPHELIIDGVNGYIVGRDINKMSERIIELYEDRQLLFDMSKRIKNDYDEMFNDDEVTKEWRDMFNDM